MCLKYSIFPTLYMSNHPKKVTMLTYFEIDDSPLLISSWAFVENLPLALPDTNNNIKKTYIHYTTKMYMSLRLSIFVGWAVLCCSGRSLSYRGGMANSYPHRNSCIPMIHDYFFYKQYKKKHQLFNLLVNSHIIGQVLVKICKRNCYHY